MMGESSSLSLEEYLTYAQADSVKDFYYTMTASLNGSDDFEPVSSDSESSSDSDDTEKPMTIHLITVHHIIRIILKICRVI